MTGFMRFILRQAVFVNIVFVGVILYGIYAIGQLPVDRYPNIQFGEVQVTTPYPGAAAEDVERLVTQEIEDALRGMKHIEYIASTSLPGRSEINVKFIDDTDYDALYTDLRLRVANIQNRLPALDGKPLTPYLTEIDVDEWLPAIQVNLVSRDREHPLDKRALILLAEDLRTRIEIVDGVKRVDLMGDQAQQFSLAINPDALERHGLTFDQVANALRGSGHSLPAGTFASSAGERAIRLDSRYRSRDDLLNVVIRRDGDGRFLTVADVIDFSGTGIRNVKDGIIQHVNGLDTVACKVLKLAAADTREVKDLVVQQVDDFLTAHADDGIEVIYTLDSTIQIEDSISVLMTSLIFGSLLVGGTLLVFLNFRAGFITVLGVAFAFIGSLVFFYLTGRSLNELSLLGFVLVVGIIVDDAIIVLENIQRHREQGDDLMTAVIEGTSQVFWPVVSATLTSIASFLPLLLMTGSIGEFFALIPVAVAVALFISLIECLIILPLHVVDLERVLGPAAIDRVAEEEVTHHSAFTERDGLIGTLHRIYDRGLQWNLSNPFRSVGIVALLFFLAIGIIVYSSKAPTMQLPPLIRFEFFPGDSSMLMMRVSMPSGTAQEETDRVVRAVAQDLIDRGEDVVANVTSMAGISIATDYKPIFANQYGFLQVQLAPEAERNPAFVNPATLVDTLRNDYAVRFADTGALIEVEIAQDGPPTGMPINVRVTGPDDTSVHHLASDLLAWMSAESRYDASTADNQAVRDLVAGTADDAAAWTLTAEQMVSADGRIQFTGLDHAQAMALQALATADCELRPRPLAGAISLKHNQDRINHVVAFRPDQRRLVQMGLPESSAFTFMAGAFDGVYVGDFRRSDEDIPIRLTFSPEIINDPVRILNLPIVHDPSGRVVRFSDVGTVETSTEPASLTRRDFQRTITITGDLAKESVLDVSAVVTKVTAWYHDHLTDYPGATIAFGGQQESTGKSYSSLIVAFGIAVFCIYLVLASQFRSYGQPLLIMTNIIFSFTGVVLVMGIFGAVLIAMPDAWVREERAYFTVHSFIALVGLTGLVVNDAIVLIDFINQRRADGLPLRQALVLAGHQRMRPIFMTTITTIAGLLPMALGLPRFSMAWTPFATCFVSGLMMSTTMTLLVVPVVYEIYEERLLPMLGIKRAADSSADDDLDDEDEDDDDRYGYDYDHGDDDEQRLRRDLTADNQHQPADCTAS